METVYWVLIGIGIALLLAILSYLVLKYIYHKPTGNIWPYLFYIFMFWMWIFTIFETPQKRRARLKKAGVSEGQTILDLGCGIGRFSLLAARIVGTAGKIYALDVNPLHQAIVRARAKAGKMENISTILSDSSDTGLPDKTVDIVFINDAFHEFDDKKGTLREVFRILKSSGTLAIDEHEMKEDKFLRIVAEVGLFSLAEKDKSLYKFKKLEDEGKGARAS
jgi:ubiquinone/menaquinone biosynthesis C-methylase UbiE